MTIRIPSELEQYVDEVVASGRCQTREEVVGEALRVFQAVDRHRSQLQRDIEEGIGSGASIPGEEVFRRLEKRAQEIASGHQT